MVLTASGKESLRALISSLDIKEPVDPSAYALKIGVRNVLSRDINANAMLIIKSGAAVIVVNKRDNEFKQRFFIAHELAHYLLHVNNDDVLHIDRPLTIRRRVETEANTVAAELLMPSRVIEQHAHRIDLFSDSHKIIVLAEQLKVSVQALSLRLKTAGSLGEI